MTGVAHINELGFFFFLRIAVEVSSSCRKKWCQCHDGEILWQIDEFYLFLLSAGSVPGVGGVSGGPLLMPEGRFKHTAG
jgi:hypothetical protein